MSAESLIEAERLLVYVDGDADHFAVAAGHIHSTKGSDMEISLHRRGGSEKLTVNIDDPHVLRLLDVQCIQNDEDLCQRISSACPNVRSDQTATIVRGITSSQLEHARRMRAHTRLAA